MMVQYWYHQYYLSAQKDALFGKKFWDSEAAVERSMLDPVGATRIPSPSWSLSKDWSTNCFHHQRIHWLLIAFEIRPRCRIWARIPHLGRKLAKSEKCIHIPRYDLNSPSSKKKLHTFSFHMRLSNDYVCNFFQIHSWIGKGVLLQKRIINMLL